MSTISPDHLPQLLQQAIADHNAGRMAEAQAIYQQILALEPNHADALHLLGVLYGQSGRLDLAIELIARAIATQPRVPLFYDSMAETYRRLGNLERAAEYFQRACQLNPRSTDALSKLGKTLRDLGRVEAAAEAFSRAATLQPGSADLHNNLGVCLLEAGKPEEAIAEYGLAIQLKPDYGDAYCNLGSALVKVKRFDEAIEACRRAIDLNGDDAEAHHARGLALGEQRKFGEAADAIGDAVRINPEHAEAFSNLANALRENGELDEAMDACRQALRLNPELADAHLNLGMIFMARADVGHAVASFRRATELRPESAEAHFNLALALLTGGEFRQGWAENEWRWKCQAFPTPPRRFAQPLWDGNELGGRTILLHCEQGFGDSIQFVRYAPLVAECGGRVILWAPPELSGLMEGAQGVSLVVAGEPFPPFDVHCPLLTLPRIFHTQLESIPAKVPYLFTDPIRAARWKHKFARSGKRLKVGLAWAGRSTHTNDRNRSLSLEKLRPLADVVGVTFYSLQKGRAAEAADRFNLTDWTDEIHDFSDTAALIEHLDLVIAVDTSVVHLAGAMGKPVWVLLPFSPDWRWLLNRDNSPWYPTMRLFRQKQIGNWDTAILEVAQALSLEARK